MSAADSESTPLYQMNPLQRFSERAADYVKSRPSYPAAAIDQILNELKSPIVAADIGAGTGISARLLAERGVKVIAIEPNAAMRQAAAPHPLVEFCEATAEATKLPDAKVDLVTCFQAFHWFEPEPTLIEFHRILKPDGRLALVWNERDRQDNFTASYNRLIEIASNSHPAERQRVAIEPLIASSLFDNIQRYTFSYEQELDLSGLIGRAMSSSYIPRQGAQQQQLVAELQQLHERSCDRQGMVYLIYNTSVFLAEPRSLT